MNYTTQLAELEERLSNCTVPYITLFPKNKDSSIDINIFDFTLLDWSITHYLREQFDEYDNYEFTTVQWNEILEEAEKIISFSTFDELFEYATDIKVEGYGIFRGGEYSVTLNNMNCSGAEFWNNKRKYEEQLKDMKAWSQMVLSESDSMIVEGY